MNELFQAIDQSEMVYQDSLKQEEIKKELFNQDLRRLAEKMIFEYKDEWLENIKKNGVNVVMTRPISFDGFELVRNVFNDYSRLYRVKLYTSQIDNVVFKNNADNTTIECSFNYLHDTFTLIIKNYVGI
jgi:hypothetical protein